MSAPPPEAALPTRFPGWEIRPSERRLLVDDRTVPVGGRAFDVLLALVVRRDRVVGKDELLAAAWPGRVVEENNLSVQVAALRKLLGPDVIVTVSGIGYRLGVSPAGTSPFHPSTSVSAAATAIAAEPPPPLVAEAPPRRPPDLVGRDDDLERLGEQVGRAPLVTLVGPGGVGKTALAREAFARRAALQLEGTAWIDLAPLSAADDVVSHVARALGVDLHSPANEAAAAASLGAALSRVRALVALDNCEHVRDAVARLLAAAIPGAPGVRWLATSQVPLHVAGEVVDRLAPLAVPDARVDPVAAMEFGSVALFARRAAASDGRFRLDTNTVDAVCRLCAELDGVPLALEMAAARVATLGLARTLEQVHARLRLRRPADGPERHRTLASVYEWSHGLLSEVEQVVFRRLEPFVGGFRLEMALPVVMDEDGGVVDDWAAADAIAALVDRSLLQRTLDAPDRFHLLESARDFARARLDEAGERDEVHARHAGALAAWFETAHDDAERLPDADFDARYRTERDNLREALRHAVTAISDAGTLARLVAGTAMLDAFRFRESEIVRVAFDLGRLDAADRPWRARARLALATAHYSDGDRELATRLAQQALEDFEAIGDAAGAFRALSQLVRLFESRPGMAEDAAQAWARLHAQDDTTLPLRTRLSCLITGGYLNRQARGIESLDQLEALARSAGFAGLAAYCRVLMTDTWLIEGRHDAVATVSPRIAEDCADFPRLRSAVLGNLVLSLVRLGRAAEAVPAAREALRGKPGDAHAIVSSFALAAAVAGQFADAAVLEGFMREVRRHRDWAPDPAEARAAADTCELLTLGLDAARREALNQLGASMSEGEAVGLALSVPAGGTMDASPAGAPGPAPSPGVRAATP